MPSVTEDFDVELVALAVTDDLAADYDRSAIGSWTIENVSFAVWLPKHLRSLRRSGKAYAARQRKITEFQAKVKEGHRR